MPVVLPLHDFNVELVGFVRGTHYYVYVRNSITKRFISLVRSFLQCLTVSWGYCVRNTPTSNVIVECRKCIELTFTQWRDFRSDNDFFNLLRDAEREAYGRCESGCFSYFPTLEPEREETGVTYFLRQVSDICISYRCFKDNYASKIGGTRYEFIE